MIQYPNINPNILTIGPFHLRWYGLAYAAGFVIGYLYIKRRFKKFNKPGLVDDTVVYAILGVIVGGRLGYVLVYNFSYYAHHPLCIVCIWKGGMSFHGALVGLIVAGLLLARKHGLSFYELADEVVVIAPVGLFFGRIANFINDELWGRVTNVPWAVAFPAGGYLPRHPSQLYEALGEGLFLLVVMLLLRDKMINTKGALFYMFILLYGLIRFFIGFTREPDPQLGFIVFGLTMGQLLCLGMIVVGIVGSILVRRGSA